MQNLQYNNNNNNNKYLLEESCTFFFMKYEYKLVWLTLIVFV